MSYSYSNSLPYGTQDSMSYSDNINTEYAAPQKKNNTLAAGCTGAVIGAGAGVFAGIKKNPYIKNGIPTDTFTKQVVENVVKTLPEIDRKTSEQLKIISKGLSKVSSAEDLKTLLNNNPEGAKEVTKDLQKFLSDLNESNLKATKNAIKNNLSSKYDIMVQDCKNKILTFWNPEKKKFEAPANAQTEIYDAINSAKKGLKLKQTIKFGAIGAAVCGILAVVLQKVLSHKKER